MSDAPTCRPPDGAASGTWHWLRHTGDEMTVLVWDADMFGTRGCWASPLPFLSATPGDTMHELGWRWVAEAVPPAGTYTAPTYKQLVCAQCGNSTLVIARPEPTRPDADYDGSRLIDVARGRVARDVAKMREAVPPGDGK